MSPAIPANTPDAEDGDQPQVASPEIVQLANDFTDDELDKLFTLHFFHHIDRSDAENLMAARQMRHKYEIFANHHGYDHDLTRIFVADMMFALDGPLITPGGH